MADGATTVAAADPVDVGVRTVTSLVRALRDGDRLASGVGPAGTGYEPLDTVLDGGLLPGELVLLGGQPGSGKTICALQWARNMARHSTDVVYACFEHDEVTLLNRLLIQELAEAGGDGRDQGAVDPVDRSERVRARALVKELTLGLMSARQAVALSPLVNQALASLEGSLPHLRLLRASSRHTTTDQLAELAARHLGLGGVLFVDYLQKVPTPGAVGLDEQVYRAMEQLKDLAVTHRVTVIALSAAGSAGINADRLRLRHLRGADALAHECDVAIVMNDKATAVAERHLKYDLTQLDEARRRTVFSVEKNRRGEVDVHIELVKDFANFRFQPRGAFLTEALADGDD